MLLPFWMFNLPVESVPLTEVWNTCSLTDLWLAFVVFVINQKKLNRRFKIFSYPEETSFSIFRANHFEEVGQKSGLNEPTNETYRCETSVCHGCPPKI